MSDNMQAFLNETQSDSANMRDAMQGVNVAVDEVDVAQAYQDALSSADNDAVQIFVSSVSSLAVRVTGGDEVPLRLGLSQAEHTIWILLHLPRRFDAIDQAKLMDTDALGKYLFALSMIGFLDVMGVESVKHMVPIEINRAKQRAAGEDAAHKPRLKLRPRVYRPDIDGDPLHERGIVITIGDGKVLSGKSAAEELADRIATDELCKNIEQNFDEMPTQNHYAFLHIPKYSDAATIRTAYMRRVKDLHPDRLAGTSLAKNAAIVEKMDQLFKHLQDAYTILSDEVLRAEYDKGLDVPTFNPKNTRNGKKIRRIEEATMEYIKAEQFFKRKDYINAESHYRLAFELDEEDPRIATMLGWCIFMNDQVDEQLRVMEAKKRLEAVIESYNYAEAAYKLALVWRSVNREDEAQKMFLRTLSIDSKHTDATRERRLFESRQQRSKDSATANGKDHGKDHKDAKSAAKDSPTKDNKPSRVVSARADDSGGFLSKIFKR